MRANWHSQQLLIDTKPLPLYPGYLWSPQGPAPRPQLDLLGELGNTLT